MATVFGCIANVLNPDISDGRIMAAPKRSAAVPDELRLAGNA
jgi:hypothetical protein